MNAKRYIHITVDGVTSAVLVDRCPKPATLRELTGAAAGRLGLHAVNYHGQPALLIYDRDAIAKQRPWNVRASILTDLAGEVSGDVVLMVGVPCPCKEKERYG